jgi:hypothetical protein
VIFTGDFNMYYSNEPAYQKIIDPSNSIVLKDPLSSDGLGNWHNNLDFTLYHTQSTHSSSDNDFVGGGLDDRFDLIFLSENFFSSSSLTYKENSYAAYGNNGNCFNKKINDSDCTGVFSFETRNHLYNMSDHLPITLVLETSSTLKVDDYAGPNIYINEASPIIDHISFNGELDQEMHLTIFDMSGKQIMDIPHYHKNSTISLAHVRKGIYFAKFTNPYNTKILRFIKG